MKFIVCTKELIVLVYPISNTSAVLVDDGVKIVSLLKDVISYKTW